MKQLLYTLLLCIVMPLTCKAQQNIIISRYTTENGLPSNTINCITNDHDGLIWLGTLYGLSSFDGTKFTPYVKHNSYSEIPPRKILNITEDNKNNLWIRTSDNRFYRFNKTTETFHDMYGDLKKVSPNLRVIKLVHIDNGNTLIYTRNKNIYEVYVDKNDMAHIQIIYNSCHAIDKNTLKLRFNVLGETEKYIFWLGPNFDVKIVSKKHTLQKKHILRTIPRGYKATCFNTLGRNIYIGTSRGDVFVINVNNGKTKRISTGTKEDITTVTPVKDKLFITTRHGIYSTSSILAKVNTETETSFADKYGILWLYSKNNGITMFNPQNKLCKNFPIRANDSLLDAVKFCDAEKNGLFILLRNGKIMRFDRVNSTMQEFTPVDIQNNKLLAMPAHAFMQINTKQNVFYDMAIDNNGILWLSSTTDGLLKVRFPSNQFSFLYSNILANDIQPANNNYGIRSLFQAKNGDLWIGTRQKTLYRIDGNTGKLKNKYTGITENIYNISEDSKGNIWLSSKGNGLTKMVLDEKAPQGVHFETYKHSNSDKFSISDNKVYYTFEDSKGRIWVCTYGGGLNLISTYKGKTVFINKNNLLKNYPQNDLYMSTREIVEDNNNTLWIATTDGLLSFNGNFKNPRNIKFNSFRNGNNPLVVDNDIFSLLKDCKGNIWLSVFGCGLAKITGYDSKSGKLTLDTFVDNGLQGYMVSTLVEDNRHNIWFTTENGLTSISEKDNKLHSYGYLDGFLRSKIEDNTAICLKSGKILIGCREGIVAYSPDKIEKESHHSYRTFIVDFKVQNKSLNSFDPPIIKICPKYAKEIELKHNQNMFSIEFSSVNYTSSSNTAFTYILDGYEQQWHANDNSRVASYANVPPGEYTFRVKTLDENSPECSVRIIILPPWWLTWWAYLIYAIIIAAAVYGGIRIALTMIKMRNDVYINNRLAEMKIRFFTNISHELRTPLTLIKNPIDGLRKHEKLSDEGKKYLNLIDRNATKMLHLVNQILDFRKVQNGKMPIHLSHACINDIVDIFYEEYKLAAKERNIELKIIKPEENIMAWCDAEKIGVIINNLINNAFKYTSSGGNITVTINSENSKCRITVADNGASIPEQQLDTIFERFSMADNVMSADSQQNGTGIGLSLAREFATMHHGRIWAENIEDNGGVVFILEIPTEKEVYNKDNTEMLIDDNTVSITPQAINSPNDNITKESQEQPYNTDRPTLVLVEDNADLRSMLSMQLQHTYNVVTAIDGIDGIEKIKETHPDLIITDLMMPKMDGAELLNRVRKDFTISHVPIIVLTAKNNDDEIAKIIENGANAFITKPFSSNMLMARIRQLLKEQCVFQRKILLQGKKTENDTSNNIDEYEKHLAKKDMEFINKIYSIIEENMQNDNFNIDTIAESVGLSRSAFFKKLKILTGYAPVDLVRVIRLNKAEKLILTTNDSVAEVAYATGFNDSSYFGKCFKKKFGMSPLEYRNKNLNKTE